MSEAPRRRWFQFSLRMLFVVVTVATVAFYLGWTGHQMHLRRESEASLEKTLRQLEEMASDDPWGLPVEINDEAIICPAIIVAPPQRPSPEPSP